MGLALGKLHNLRMVTESPLLPFFMSTWLWRSEAVPGERTSLSFRALQSRSSCRRLHDDGGRAVLTLPRPDHPHAHPGHPPLWDWAARHRHSSLETYTGFGGTALWGGDSGCFYSTCSSVILITTICRVALQFAKHFLIPPLTPLKQPRGVLLLSSFHQ